MARKTTTILPPADELTDMEAQEANALERVLQAKEGDTGGSVWKVLVMRVAGPDRRKDGSETRIIECGIDDLDFLSDRLRKEFGDGVYRVRVRKDGSNAAQWDISIELSPAERVAYRRRVQALEREAEGAPAPAAQNAGSELANAIAAAMKYQADMFAGILRDRQPAADPLEMFKQFAELQKSLAPAPAVAGGFSSFKEGIEFAEKFLDKDSGGESGSIWTFLKGLADNPEIGGALKEFAKGAARHMQEPQRQPPARQVQHRPGPQAQPPAQRPAPQPAPAAQESLEDRAIKYLIGQATMGADPALVSETAVQLIPQERMAQLDNLSEEQALDYLTTAYPETAQYRAWFAGLLRAIYPPEGETDGPQPETDAAAKLTAPAP